MKDHASRAMHQLRISGVDVERYEDARADVPLRHFNIAAEKIADWHAKILAKYGLHAVQIDDGLWGVYDVATAEEMEKFTNELADDKLANLRTQYDAEEQGDDSLSEEDEQAVADDMDRADGV